jgi:hypothetical protein
MEAGQRLIAHVKEREIFLDATPGADGTRPADTRPAAPVPPPAEVVRPAVSPASPVRPSAHTRAVAPAPSAAPAAPALADHGSGWAKQVAAGDFQAVIADAEHRGLDGTLSSASAAELGALADAARYLRRGDLARRTLLAARDRFPRSREGREAAFFLGGLSEDQSGEASSKAALDWYERYLTESPQGPYAAHALGREMVLVHKLQGTTAARPIAERYLQRFPHGPYTAAAQKLVDETP